MPKPGLAMLLLASLLGPTATTALAQEPGAALRTLLGQARTAFTSKRYDESSRLLRQALALPADDLVRAELDYDLACAEALQRHEQPALQALKDAVALGYTDWSHAAQDEDLRAVRDRDAFKALVGVMKEGEVRRRVFDVTRWDDPDLGAAALHSFDDWRGEQASALRTTYRLGDVVAGKKTQLERQLAALAWVHARWSHDGWEQPSHADALTILREAQAGKRFRCVEYSITLVQVLQALGFPARVVSLRRDGASFGLGKGHVVTEAWNDELGKWLVLDGQNDATWQDGDRMLNAAEVRALRLAGKPVRMVHHGSPWMRDWREEPQRAKWSVYFDHLSYGYDNALFSPRLQRPAVDLVRPGERYELLFQGVPQVGHTQTQALETIYPEMNRVHLDLGTDGKPGAASPFVDVSMSNSCPSFDHYEVLENGRSTTQRDAHHRWMLVPGRSSIEVRAVNAAGERGMPSRIDVTYYPPSPQLPGVAK